MQDHEREATWQNGYECEVYGGMHVGRDSAGSNPRLCLKKKGIF